MGPLAAVYRVPHLGQLEAYEAGSAGPSELALVGEGDHVAV
jgi:hypothetical protein